MTEAGSQISSIAALVEQLRREDHVFIQPHNFPDHNGAKINLSVRSEEPSWDASRIVRTVLAGRGFGGGHADMAGGVIPDAEGFDTGQLLDDVERLLTAVPASPPSHGQAPGY